MERCLVAGFCLWFTLAFVIADENKSSVGSLIWSSAKEEGDLLIQYRPEEDSTAAAPVAHDADGFDGGFSSLDSMLQWAIALYHCRLVGSEEMWKVRRVINTMRWMEIEDGGRARRGSFFIEHGGT